MKKKWWGLEADDINGLPLIQRSLCFSHHPSLQDSSQFGVKASDLCPCFFLWQPCWNSGVWYNWLRCQSYLTAPSNRRPWNLWDYLEGWYFCILVSCSIVLLSSQTPPLHPLNPSIASLCPLLKLELHIDQEDGYCDSLWNKLPKSLKLDRPLFEFPKSRSESTFLLTTVVMNYK